MALIASYLSTAPAVQEDLKGTAGYVARHARPGDHIALPDHAITTAVGYYLTRDQRPLPLWPQLGVGQRYVEGFDLVANRRSIAHWPRRVWLVSDGSVPQVVKFRRFLHQNHYVILKRTQFTGVTLVLYRLARRAATPPVSKH